MQIGRRDIFWNYGATFLKIASSAILLPFILRMLPSETIGIWAIFMTITAFASLLDFGFSSSFTRNVTYVFSGVKNLKINGFETVNKVDFIVDFGLLKGVIFAMRWFYSRIAILLFVFLATLGTYYIYILLKNYKGERQDVYIAWAMLCLISTYNIYTLYYDALLQGKGLIKRSKQIVIAGQAIYLVIAILLILAGNGLIAIVSAQASSVLIIRYLSYRSFFTKEIKRKLHSSQSKPRKEVLKAITPNAIKIGLTTLGGFMVQRSSIVIGSLYLPLKDIASYGISMQLIGVISGLAAIYTATYQPIIVKMRVENNIVGIKNIYLKGQIVLLLTYLSGGLTMLYLGEFALHMIGSKTILMSFYLLLLALILSFEQTNLSIAGGILVTKNEVPFFKASLISGVLIVMGLLGSFSFTNFGLYNMIVVPLITDLGYQAWQWPLKVMRELKVTRHDIILKF